MAVQDLYKLIFQAAMAAVGLLPFALDELRRFFAAMQAQAFPAVHHSKRYRQAYRPAYRVIVQRFLTDHSARW